MKTLYFECQSGISGDMTVAALLDLGVPEGLLRAELRKLGLDGYDLKLSRAQKSGIGAQLFDVVLHAHTHENEHSHDHPHEHSHAHGHTHDHEDENGHRHDPVHEEHDHEHRSMADIAQMIEASALSDSVKTLSLGIFGVLAEAEGKVHGKPASEVHFHEVGAIDSIVDIVSAAVCMDYIAPDRVQFSRLREGMGYVRCQHGLIPVPVPATLELLSKYKIPFEQTEVRGEMITPTGAAIAAFTGGSFGQTPPIGTVTAVGYGAGHKDFDHPNLLRVLLIESSDSADEPGDDICLIQTVIDDSTGEELSFAMQALFKNGAKDVYFTPCFMKKNRPAYELSVMCDPEREEEMSRLVFTHTTAIGLRASLVHRRTMARSTVEKQTEFGPIKFKKCTYNAVTRLYPEYESLAQAAQEHGVPLREILDKIK